MKDNLMGNTLRIQNRPRKKASSLTSIASRFRNSIIGQLTVRTFLGFKNYSSVLRRNLNVQDLSNFILFTQYRPIQYYKILYNYYY